MHFKEFLKKFNLKNLDKALTKFDKGMSEFNKTVKESTEHRQTLGEIKI